MAVEGVAAGVNAAISTQLRARQSEPGDQAQRAENDRARVERETAERARVQDAQAAQSAQSRPTVNAEGQQVGTRINITA